MKVRAFVIAIVAALFAATIIGCSSDGESPTGTTDGTQATETADETGTIDTADEADDTGDEPGEPSAPAELPALADLDPLTIVFTIDGELYTAPAASTMCNLIPASGVAYVHHDVIWEQESDVPDSEVVNFDLHVPGDEAEAGDPGDYLTAVANLVIYFAGDDEYAVEHATEVARAPTTPPPFDLSRIEISGDGVSGTLDVLGIDVLTREATGVTSVSFAATCH